MSKTANELPFFSQDVVTSAGGRNELVGLADIEMVYKKRKHDKESRLATVMKGREGREAFGSKKGRGDVTGGGSTNKEKAKAKSFQMMKHKIKKKVKRSFVEKQKDMRKAMVKSRKFK
jgi:protein SDA1